MSIKMILTDLDKTLLRSDASISGHTKQVLKRCQARGILVVIATARYWIGAERYIEEIRPDYAITTDGTLIHRCRPASPDCSAANHAKQIYSRSMDAKTANQIIQDLLRQDPKTEITVASGIQVFWNSSHISESEKLYKAVYSDYSRSLTCPVNKIVAELSDNRIAAETAARNHCHLQSYRGENWYAFLPEDAGKIQAIRALAESLDIPLSDIAAFGDDTNDMEMLRICGTGVAVANAIDDVRATADCIALSNDEEGVADWIETNIL